MDKQVNPAGQSSDTLHALVQNEPSPMAVQRAPSPSAPHVASLLQGVHKLAVVGMVIISTGGGSPPPTVISITMGASQLIAQIPLQQVVPSGAFTQPLASSQIVEGMLIAEQL